MVNKEAPKLYEFTLQSQPGHITRQSRSHIVLSSLYWHIWLAPSNPALLNFVMHNMKRRPLSLSLSHPLFVPHVILWAKFQKGRDRVQMIGFKQKSVFDFYYNT